MQILAPHGGFANHVRWLLWLTIPEPVYHHRVMILEEDVYEIFHEDGWPATLSEFNKLEFKDLPYFEVINTKDRVDFISQNVYPPARTKENWLEYEWKHRNTMEIYCRAKHYMSDLDKNVKTIVMKTTYENASKHYNGMSKYKITAQHLQEVYKNLPKDHLLMNCTDLLNEKLDKNFYTSATSYFGIDNDYESAKIVHKLWYDRIK